MKKAIQLMIAAASTSFFISCDDSANTGNQNANGDTTSVVTDTAVHVDVPVVDTATTVEVDTTAMANDTIAAIPEPAVESTTEEVDG